MSEPCIGVAIIGLGLWGERAHLPAFAARPDVEVRAVVEPREGRAEALAEQYGVPRAETDAGALFRDPEGLDAVVIATPEDTHRDLTLAAFAAGLHVLCEKPLARDLGPAREMAAAAHAAGRVGKVGFLFRFSPVVQRMKELVDAGYIGAVRLVESSTVNAQFVDPQRPRHWKMQRERANGGVFVEYGSHAIDLAQWFGGPIARVVANGATLVPERPLAGGGRGVVDTDDAATWIAEFAGGGQAVFCSGWASYPSVGGGLRVYGSHGTIAWNRDPTGRSSESLVAATADDPVPHAIFDYTYPPDPADGAGGFTIGISAHYNARLAESFVNDIRAGRASGPSFADGLAAQRVLAAIRTSLDEGRWATVDAA